MRSRSSLSRQKHTSLTSGSTATILTCLCVASLILSPKHLGSENSRLFALQKSGIVTIILALISFVVTLVAFCIEIAVALPAKNRLNNAADGITASLVSARLILVWRM